MGKLATCKQKIWQNVDKNRGFAKFDTHSHTSLHTCPSMIHLEMAVLPSLPEWNFMVAERGLMLEMTRLEGAPGSSVHQHKQNIFLLLTSCSNWNISTFCVLFSVCFLHPVSSLSFKENSSKWAHNSLQSRLGFVYSSAHCVWVYD